MHESDMSTLFRDAHFLSLLASIGLNMTDLEEHVNLLRQFLEDIENTTRDVYYVFPSPDNAKKWMPVVEAIAAKTANIRLMPMLTDLPENAHVLVCHVAANMGLATQFTPRFWSLVDELAAQNANAVLLGLRPSGMLSSKHLEIEKEELKHMPYIEFQARTRNEFAALTAHNDESIERLRAWIGSSDARPELPDKLKNGPLSFLLKYIRY